MSQKNKQLFEKVDFESKEFEEHVHKTLYDMINMLIEKNKGYGGASMDLGLIGNYSKIHDKEMRIKSLIEKEFFGDPISFEGLDDTYRDLIGYAVIGLYIHSKLNQNKSDVENAAHFRWINLGLINLKKTEENPDEIENAYLSNMDNPVLFFTSLETVILSKLKTFGADKEFIDKVRNLFEEGLDP